MTKTSFRTVATALALTVLVTGCKTAGKDAAGTDPGGETAPPAAAPEAAAGDSGETGSADGGAGGTIHPIAPGSNAYSAQQVREIEKGLGTLKSVPVPEDEG